MKKQAFNKAVIGLAGLAVLLVLVNALAVPRLGSRSSQGSTGDVRVFFFVAVSQAPPADDGSIPKINMRGSGRFSPDRGEVQGGGSYLRNNAADPVPRPALDSGTWQATEIVSFDLVPDGTYGRTTAGILVLRIRLFSDVDGSVSTGTLKLACNIGDAGITTGEEEGYRLTIDDTSFGEFRPLTPPTGQTNIGVLATP